MTGSLKADIAIGFAGLEPLSRWGEVASLVIAADGPLLMAAGCFGMKAHRCLSTSRLQA